MSLWRFSNPSLADEAGSRGGSSLRRKAPKRVTDRREVRAVPGGDNPSGFACVSLLLGKEGVAFRTLIFVTNTKNIPETEKANWPGRITEDQPRLLNYLNIYT